MSLLEALGLAAAGWAAGAINAVAGGGSLISFPALLAVGYAPVAANVTNSVALWPGYVGGALGFRGQLEGQRPALRALGVTSVAGALAGTALLLSTPSSWFAALAPWLLLVAAALVGLQPALAGRVRALPGGSGEHRAPLLHVATLLAATYGAYFGAGVSVVVLGVLGLFLADGLLRLSALRSVLVLAINTIALAGFAVFGPVAWDAAAVMALASLAGGWAGASVAQRVDPAALRASVVVVAVAAAAVMLAT
ncbi:MAG: uncharacterized protein QOJ35_1783 [Solirubrobacteraceae bacterium]|jgi:uncharacterized membrane protein YfcA|nr:uncharacterized protein [Solirubrobacteraceae bacterium]